LHHNHIASIDIDNLKTTQQAQEIRDKISKHPSTLLSLLSTRGKGVKALMLIDANYTPDQQHKQLKNVFKPYLKDYLNIDSDHIDSAQFVLSQPCYLSFDSDMYFNKDAAPLKLDFNYKEPTRTPYKKVIVPSTSGARIDKYILSVLANTIDKLNPNTARHPQLYKIKILGQLNHYAPHLESEIISCFIESGINMYGKESMRSNVTANVKAAFNDGLKDPINNQVLDEIIREGNKTKPKINTANDTTHKLNKQYLSQDKTLIQLLKKSIKKGKFTSVTAPTGTGKSFLCSVLANDSELKHRIVLLSPLRSIVEQQRHLMEVVHGGVSDNEIAVAENSNILACTYASAHKLKNTTSDVILVIDEAHLLVSRSNILEKEIKAIHRLMQDAAKVVFITATPVLMMNEIYGCNNIIVKVNRPKKDVQPLFYDSKNTKQTDAILKFIATHKEGINVICFNDKAKLEELKIDLINLGIYKENEIAKFTADVIDTENKNYELLIDQQRIDNNIRLVLATSKIAEGVNINNDNQFNVLVVGNKDATYFVQATARFRKAKKLNLFSLFSCDFKEQKASNYNSHNLYLELKKEVQQVPTDFPEYKHKSQLSTINIDWKDRAILFVDGCKPLINHFEILNQVEKIQSSYLDFDTWKNQINKLDPSIKFQCANDIKQQKNKDLDNTRKARKEQKTQFLSRVREKLKTPEAGSILKFVRSTTKNTQLKKDLNLIIPSFSESEKLEPLMLKNNYSEIERYVYSITRLMFFANENDYFLAVNLFCSSENHKKNNFSTLIKRLTVSQIKKDGVQSKKEQIILNSVTAIENAFSNYADDSFEISKEEMNKVMRSKLKYKIKDLNITNIVSRIGVSYEVEYSKTTKKYKLKKALKKGYHKISFFIEQTEKQVTNKPSTPLGQANVFNVKNISMIV
jgi:ribose 1,5-bisphosphokinase PhnN